MFKKLAKQLKRDLNKDDYIYSSITSPINRLKTKTKDSFLKGLSRQALDLYERKTDINNFTRLALSNPENTSHDKIVDELFDNGKIKDVMSDEALFDLSGNERFLKDLGL